MAEERGFEVIDRRRVQQEAPAAPEAAGAPAEETNEPIAEAPADDVQAGGEAWSEEAAAEGLQGGMPDLSVGNILRMTLGLLSEAAWVKMGLIPNPLTGQMDRDLGEARRAIDAVTDMARHVEASATPDEKREIQVMLSNLRLNFVQQSNRTE